MGQCQLHPVSKGLQRLLPPLGNIAPRGGGGDIVKAVDTGDFLGQVLHKGNIISPGWNLYAIYAALLRAYLEIKLLQNLNHPLSRYLRAQAAVNLLCRKGNMDRLLSYRININYALSDSACPHLLQELCRPVKSPDGSRHIRTALKAAGSLGVKTASTGGATDAGTVKAGCLQHNSSRTIRYL